MSKKAGKKVTHEELKKPSASSAKTAAKPKQAPKATGKRRGKDHLEDLAKKEAADAEEDQSSRDDEGSSSIDSDNENL